MVPLERVTQVHPDMNIQLALQAMDQKNLSHVTVHDGKSTTGVITRDQIHHYLALLGELGVH
jgi:predicted transcriptional regulator